MKCNKELKIWLNKGQIVRLRPTHERPEIPDKEFELSSYDIQNKTIGGKPKKYLKEGDCLMCMGVSYGTVPIKINPYRKGVVIRSQSIKKFKNKKTSCIFFNFLFEENIYSLGISVPDLNNLDKDILSIFMLLFEVVLLKNENLF